jgi:predicted DNA-binding protein
MSNIGRPKGNNNKEYVYSLRMDEHTKNRLEAYCRLLNKTKSEVIRTAIDNLREENVYGENLGCNNNENGFHSD